MADEDVAWCRRLIDAKPGLEEISCWTVIQPLTMPVTVPEMARRLGGDPAEIDDRTGWGFEEPVGMVHLQQVGPAVVTFEVTGAEGVRDEALRWLSDGAMVHSSWWCEATGHSSLCYAAFGQVLTRLEDLDDGEPTGEQPTALDEDRALLRGDLDYPAQLAFVERRTGIRLDSACLDQPHPTVVLRTPIPDDPRPPGTFGSADPDLAAMLVLAGEPTQRDAPRWMLDQLADEQDPWRARDPRCARRLAAGLAERRGPGTPVDRAAFPADGAGQRLPRRVA
jgi:hypothetical protein